MNRPFVLSFALLAGMFSACSAETGEAHEDRAIILGVDGLDPDTVLEMVAKGELPNFKRLIERGSFGSLQTSWPPQSPVAWSNFITGVNPGKHGLYDFIHLDRSQYGLLSSMSHTEPVGLEANLFGYKIPLTGGSTTSTRKFPAFWNELNRAGVPVAVHRIPANFPLEEDSEAVVFPDMGTPDLPGAASGLAFLWFERSAMADERGWGGRRTGSSALQPVNVRRFNVDDEGRGVATATGTFTGPPDLDGTTSTSPVTFSIDTTGERPMLAAETELGLAIAQEGDWSDWVQVDYSLMGGMSAVSGWTRFMFVSAAPFAVYAAPVQMDPFAGDGAVSHPADASAELADAIGAYYTQGFPDAYKSYKIGLLTTEEFVSQSDTVLIERMEMLEYALDHFERDGGLLFFYTGSLDLRCHMLWHCVDDQHPHQEPSGVVSSVPQEYAEKAEHFGLGEHLGMSYAEQINRVYRQVDDLLGYLLDRHEAQWPDAEFMVMSDHGFAPMRRVMNVNDWLVQEGYLVLKEGEASGSIGAYGTHEDGSIDWDSSPVDWEKTRAFSVGFNGVILNRVGREPRGMVQPDQAPALLAEMSVKLLKLQDQGNQVLTRVLPASEVYEGDQLEWAPDLQLGFNVGFGASDPSAEGQVTGDAIIVDNDSRWSGSHLMDPELVRGTIATLRPHTLPADPALEDITATVYNLFDVTPPAGMDGKPLF